MGGDSIPLMTNKIKATVYDRIDAAATSNFSTQFGAATIRERHLFESGVYFFRRGYKLKIIQ